MTGEPQLRLIFLIVCLRRHLMCSYKLENGEAGGGYIFCERPSSGIAGWRGGWIAGIGSEGTRPAVLPAGPVPERWNVNSVFIETPNGQRLAGRAGSHIVFRSPEITQCGYRAIAESTAWLISASLCPPVVPQSKP